MLLATFRDIDLIRVVLRNSTCDVNIQGAIQWDEVCLHQAAASSKRRLGQDQKSVRHQG